MRRLVIAIAVTGLLSLASLGTTLGHVHGITPLRCVGVADDGANAVDGTPAATGNGGPAPLHDGRTPPMRLASSATEFGRHEVST